MPVRPARLLGAVRVGVGPGPPGPRGGHRRAAARGSSALAGGDPEAVRGEHVQAAAREGDPDALAVIDEFGRWVALGLVNLTNLLDPEVFVLGGGLAAAADLVLEPIRRHFAELALRAAHLRPHPAHRRVAALGEHAGAIGAALLATDASA